MVYRFCLTNNFQWHDAAGYVSLRVSEVWKVCAETLGAELHVTLPSVVTSDQDQLFTIGGFVIYSQTMAISIRQYDHIHYK